MTRSWTGRQGPLRRFGAAHRSDAVTLLTVRPIGQSVKRSALCRGLDRVAADRRSDDENRARRVPDDLIGHAADQRPSERSAAMAPDDDQVSAFRIRGGDDRLGRVALPDRKLAKTPSGVLAGRARPQRPRLVRSWSIRLRNRPPGSRSVRGSMTQTASSRAFSAPARSKASSVAASDAGSGRWREGSCGSPGWDSPTATAAVATTSGLDDQRGDHAEHPVGALGVGQDVAVERPRARVRRSR